MDGVGHSTMVAVEAATGARTRKRDSLFMSARLRVVGAEPVEVRVRNLSEGGLMIEHERVLAPGCVVHLDMRGLGEVTGTVAWCTRGRIGIALDAPIDPKRARTPVSAGGATPAYAKPALVARAPRR